ncbi:hypothetical protein [Paenibacillus sp. UNC451MF]|uniref:hypothetical protein n=1 Tax=Paenibacillus sp. UNC451MF TaxID=1449063 RepID=UPI00048D61F0|nr:hypothetical protein [Paenibacillus sp. UNC451MF]
MKVGTFLLGGLVGAAAVIYFNNKSKSMLFSAISSNKQSLGNVSDKSKERSSEHMNGNAQHSSEPVSNMKKEESSASDGLSRVEAIINKEPEIKAVVDEILAENHQKEVYQTQ